MNITSRIARLGALTALLAGLCAAQTTLTSTTLSAAITGTRNAQTRFVVASATGITAPTATSQIFLVVDQEAMKVLAVNSTTIDVQRGANNTQVQAHISGATVWVGAGSSFAQASIPYGAACTRTQLTFVPLVISSGANAGQAADCIGGRYVRTDAPGNVTATTTAVSSASTIVPTATMFPVSGVTAVVNITVPAGWGNGMCLEIQPTGIFATTTAGNIGLITSASVVGRILRMCWNGSKWYPSYVS